MTRKGNSKRPASEILLLVAQGLALVALVFGLIFLLNTTGGTLFLFSALAPILVGLACVIVAGVAIYQYRKRHQLFEVEDYEPGDLIFREGEVGECAYFIHSGEVEVVRAGQGQPQVVARLGQGEYFGEVALITNTPRNATLRAASKVRVAVLGKENFKALLSVLPSTKGDILKTVQARAMAAAHQLPQG